MALVGIIALFLLLILAQALFEGGVGGWIKWSFSPGEERRYTTGQRVSQVLLVAVFGTFVVWWAGIALDVFPVP